MASQLAQILTNFGNQSASKSGSGLETGVKNYLTMRQQGVENKRASAKAEREKTTFDQTQQDRKDADVFGVIGAANTPEKWINAQASGFIPKNLQFEKREPLLMGYVTKQAYKTGKAGAVTEVGDATSPTGTRNVLAIDAIGMPGKPQKPLVDMSNTQEKEESKQYGKALVEGYTAIRDDARNAQTALQQYEMAKNIDLQESGPLEGWKVGAIALAEGLGFDPSSIGRADNAGAYQGVMQNMVLSKMQAQKGPQTENDSKRIERTLATLGNTEGARKFLLDAGMALEQEKVDRQNFWMKWRDTHNGTFDGAERAWNEFKKKTPFLANNPKTGRPVFFQQFVQKVQSVNPDAEYSDIVDLWQKKYARATK